MTMPIEQAAINLAVALGLSAVVGFERQWRNRLAGLRTNTLVSLGAATFVIFAAVVPGDASPTRIAAQVVSGIGFLGAGLIFREGLGKPAQRRTIERLLDTASKSSGAMKKVAASMRKRRPAQRTKGGARLKH